VCAELRFGLLWDLDAGGDRAEKASFRSSQNASFLSPSLHSSCFICASFSMVLQSRIFYFSVDIVKNSTSPAFLLFLLFVKKLGESLDSSYP